MFIKLAARNVARSTRDYAVYFTTVVLTVAMLFAFNSVVFSETIHELYRYLWDSSVTLIIVTVIVTLVAGWLINYTTRFILQKRSREFAIYFTLGLERGQVSRLFLLENLTIGAVSCCFGLLAGVLLFQFLTSIIQNLFQVEYHFRLEFNGSALLLTLCCFAAIYLYAVVRSHFVLNRIKVTELLSLSRKNESARLKNPWFYLAMLVGSLALCAFCLIRVREGLLFLEDASSEWWWKLMAGGCTGVVGTFGFYVGLSHLMPFWLERNPGKLYRGVNLFLVRQTTSKLNSGGALMGAVALLLTLTMVSFGGGMLYASSEAQNTSGSDFDVSITLSDPNIDFSPQLELLADPFTIRDQLSFNVYTTESPALQGLFNGLTAPRLDYYQDGIQVISHSDYSGMLRQNGIPPLPLITDEFVLGVNSFYLEKRALENRKTTAEITLGGHTLRAGLPENQGIYRGKQGPWRMLLVLPDEVLRDALAKGELKFSRCGLIVTTEEGVSAEYTELLSPEPIFQVEYSDGTAYITDQDGLYVDARGNLVLETSDGQQLLPSYVDDQGNLVLETSDGRQLLASYSGRYWDMDGKPVSGYASTIVREDWIASRRSSTAVICFALFYLGMVFAFIAATILAVQQLSDSTKYRSRFDLLRKLGVPEGQISRLVLRQLAFYFGLPLVVPVVMTALLMAIFDQGFSQFIPSPTLWITTLLVMLGLFLSIYICYFLITFFSFQRNITDK